MQHLKLILTLAIGAALLSALACSGDDDDLPIETIEVEVGAAGLDPQEVTIRVPDRYSLIVENTSETECAFSLGNFVQDLVVPPGDTGHIDFITPDDEPAEQQQMGCGDGRSGDIVILDATVP